MDSFRKLLLGCATAFACLAVVFAARGAETSHAGPYQAVADELRRFGEVPFFVWIEHDGTRRVLFASCDALNRDGHQTATWTLVVVDRATEYATTMRSGIGAAPITTGVNPLCVSNSPHSSPPASPS